MREDSTEVRAPISSWRSRAFLAPQLAVLFCAVFARSDSSFAQELMVEATRPSLNALNVPLISSVRVTFDRAVRRSSVTSRSFWAYGRSSGPVRGAFEFSDDDRTVSLVPRSSFHAGEVVTAILSHDLVGADDSPLRSAGFSFQFTTRTRPSSASLERIQVFSNGDGSRTRIYGAAATDLNGDGFLDLTTVNEISADLRTMMNRGDGSGIFSTFPAQRVPVGVQASPNDTGDFDRDGLLDIVVSASQDHNVWIVLQQGAGLYRGPAQDISVGREPHGVVCLDADGDGDLDVANANTQSNNLSVMLNDGTGVFGEPTFFDGGVEFEYGLAAGDMNGDGILDLVAAGQIGERIRTLLGNGDGTYSWLPLPVQGAGGQPWVVSLGDLDGDGDLDVTAANGHIGNGAVLLNNGDGSFAAPVVYEVGGLVISTDLGDLDGDGDLDWVLSCFEAKIWRVLENDGSGNFSTLRDLPCSDDLPCGNPSCAILFDFDNDRDLDIVVTDEIVDTIQSFRNGTREIFGDENGDGAVDARDAERFAECFSGKGNDAGLACQFADFDGDGDVDCMDRAQFREAWTGEEPLAPFEPCEDGGPHEVVFRRGEVNLDGLFDLADSVAIFVALFQGGEAPGCPDSADANDDQGVDISDGIYILLFLFGGGGAPPDPGPTECGVDPTVDALSDCEYPAANCP